MADERTMKKWRRVKPVRYPKRPWWHELVGRAALATLGLLLAGSRWIVPLHDLVANALLLAGGTLVLLAILPVWLLERLIGRPHHGSRSFPSDFDLLP